MSEYTFDIYNFNTIMREMFIYRMNKLSGFDPDTGENPGQAEHFDKAQADMVTLRQMIEKNYAAGLKKKECPPLWAFGMAIHQRYVETGMSFKAVLKTSPSKHFSKALKVYEDLKPETPELTPGQIQEIMRKFKK